MPGPRPPAQCSRVTGILYTADYFINTYKHLPRVARRAALYDYYLLLAALSILVYLPRVALRAALYERDCTTM